MKNRDATLVCWCGNASQEEIMKNRTVTLHCGCGNASQEKVLKNRTATLDCNCGNASQKSSEKSHCNFRLWLWQCISSWQSSFEHLKSTLFKLFRIQICVPRKKNSYLCMNWFASEVFYYFPTMQMCRKLKKRLNSGNKKCTLCSILVVSTTTKYKNLCRPSSFYIHILLNKELIKD
jgi:hypothetical protein